MKIEYQTRKLDNTCDKKSPKSISVAGLGFFEKRNLCFESYTLAATLRKINAFDL
jgi:hypothetical protein